MEESVGPRVQRFNSLRCVVRLHIGQVQPDSYQLAGDFDFKFGQLALLRTVHRRELLQRAALHPQNAQSAAGLDIGRATALVARRLRTLIP